MGQQQILWEAGCQVSRIYFPNDAIVSLVVSLSTGQTIEAAITGRDGIVGAAAAIDGRYSFSRAIVQIAGTAWAGDVEMLKQVTMQSPALLSMIIRHDQTLYAQAQQSAACLAYHKIEARLCRWLLRTRHLSGRDTLPLTQEFLAEMLGVGRPSVSIAAHTLQKAGLITCARGRIQILDAEGLHESACECYETVASYYAALVGQKANH